MNETAETLSFEQALERLESVVKDLESNETGLDMSLTRYEDGVRLLKRCRAILDEAEQKIRLLTGVDAVGNPITQEFDAASTAERPTANNEPATKGKRNTGRGSRRFTEDTAEEGEKLF